MLSAFFSAATRLKVNFLRYLVSFPALFSDRYQEAGVSLLIAIHPPF
jgi:hypothetical protein